MSLRKKNKRTICIRGLGISVDVLKIYTQLNELCS